MRRPLWIGSAVLAAAGAAALAIASSRSAPPPDLPAIGELPSFELTDQRGEQVSDADLRGHVIIAHFIFTRCPTVCPVSTRKMRKVEERTRKLGDDLQIVSFSVDPAYDTPERLRAFAEKHRADTSRWSFLTGPVDAMREKVQGALKIAVDRQGTLEGGVPNIIHGTHFVLLDRDLQIRGYYDSDEVERLDELVEHARYLARSR